MASTRMNNTPGEYRLQQNEYLHQRNFMLFKNNAVPTQSVFPGLGINMPLMNGGYQNEVLSRNTADVESALFGVGSTNLVNPKAPTYAKINKMPEKAFFELPKKFLPEPLVVEKHQRPKGPFC